MGRAWVMCTDPSCKGACEKEAFPFLEWGMGSVFQKEFIGWKILRIGAFLGIGHTC